MHDVDVGTSGGMDGFDRGYCLMIGGENETGSTAAIFATLAHGAGDTAGPPAEPRHGTADRLPALRPHGRRSLVKMVHNGIEYGINGHAYAEGPEHPARRKKSERARHAIDAPRRRNARPRGPTSTT